jgi:transposase
MTPVQIKIRELEKRIRYIEEATEILKKATVPLLSDSM